MKCFVAYPSTPPSLNETIESFIEDIKKGQSVTISGWKELCVSGKLIISVVCDEIKNSDVFICDSTYLNPNVFFELGYAIAKNKKIWIIFNENIERAKKDHEQLRLLTTIGYASYSNYQEIVRKFYVEKPYETSNLPFLKTINLEKSSKNDMLLYVKSIVETDAALKLTQKIGRLKFPIIVDDPKEIGMSSLSWYIEKVLHTTATIVHFLSNDYTGSRFYNAKNALIAGLAFGFDKDLLMLAHSPYFSPIDYREYLKVHETAAQCESFAEEWLRSIEKDYTEIAKSSASIKHIKGAQRQLFEITIGEPVAENEEETLSEYFVETSYLHEGLHAANALFVAQKGVGKTALLYAINEKISKDKRNHVCIIKPPTYEFQGLIEILKESLSLSEKGYLAESLWKFLLYTEMLRGHYFFIKDQEAVATELKDLIYFCDNKLPLVKEDFSVRLDSLIRILSVVAIKDSSSDLREKINSQLYAKYFSEMKTLINTVFSRKKKVIILVDNLDKAWERGEDLQLLAKFLLALLRVSRNITKEFSNLSIIIFLRSDIFDEILNIAREPDKITANIMTWNDPLTLARIIEERFRHSLGENMLPDNIWAQYFCLEIDAVSTKEYIVSHILPRPRDLIFFIREALNNARNRGHAKIEKDDIVDAEKRSAANAFESMLAECGKNRELIESLAYEFLGATPVITKTDIQKALIKYKKEEYIDKVITLLCDLSFIGLEIERERFCYLYDENSRKKYAIMAKKLADGSNGNQRFQIHRAFHAYLEIK